MIEVYVDGLCEPQNPGGIATYGFVVLRDGEVITERCGMVGSGQGMSNNVAEYAGLCAALEYLLDRGYNQEEIVIRSDSQLIVNQMSGQWKIRGGLYIDWILKAAKLASRFGNLRYEWIPREQNSRADSLARRVYARVRWRAR